MAFSKTLNWNDSGRFTFDSSLIEIDANGCRLKSPFSTANPRCEERVGITVGSASGFSVTASASGSDSVTYIIKKNDVMFYHNGASWVESDGTLAQSNTAAQVNSNISSLITGICSIKIIAVLHSASGASTPEIDQTVMPFSYPAIATSAITLNIKDLLGDVPSGITAGKLIASVENGFFHNETFIVPGAKSANFNGSGVATLTVMETETTGQKLRFIAVIPDGTSFKTIIFKPHFVPNTGSQNILAFTGVQEVI